MFPIEMKTRQINLIVESKGDTLITKETFAEMIQFEELLFSITEFSDTKRDRLGDIIREGKGTQFSFADICR